MIFMLDNYDSFTYNLVQYMGELGAEMEVARNDKTTVEEVMASRPAGIVVSPGPCTPNEAGISNDLIAQAAGKIPLLGVCLGHQCIGQVFGGSIIRAQTLMHGKTSLIHHQDSGIFTGLENPFVATRYHSLIIDPASMPSVLDVTARADDGTIMSVRHRQHSIYGVQFHPESILTTEGKRLLQNFLNIVEQNRTQETQAAAAHKGAE
ncbi:MAG: aminodeoxychorismate/anthranilate synthase component II [Chloroflexota bacterium]|nr:aminodeoxychorismate/anthranilate synthase component II [Chloroflexota bacterium]MDE2929903.1 aminodeoxychorismate/anthranilate synthase component II [Chloroflexota bacterium]